MVASFPHIVARGSAFPQRLRRKLTVAGGRSSPTFVFVKVESRSIACSNNLALTQTFLRDLGATDRPPVYESDARCTGLAFIGWKTDVYWRSHGPSCLILYARASCSPRLDTRCPFAFPALKMKRNTIAKDFEAKQANPSGTLDRTLGNEPTSAPSLGGTTGVSGADWSGNGIPSDQFASKDELGELRQAVAMKVRTTVGRRDDVCVPLLQDCGSLRVFVLPGSSHAENEDISWSRLLKLVRSTCSYSGQGAAGYPRQDAGQRRRVGHSTKGWQEPQGKT